MAKKYNGGIPLVTSFRLDKAEPITDNEIVTLLADLTSNSVLEYPYKGMKVYVEEDGNTYEWNGLDRTNSVNWVDKLTNEINRATAAEVVLTNAVNSVTSGVRYAIPQSGNTPTTEPAPTQNGIYRVKTINATYTNWGSPAIVIPNDAGFIYDIQVSGLPSSPVYTLLSTDVNITIDVTPTPESPNPVTSGGVKAMDDNLQNQINGKVNRSNYEEAIGITTSDWRFALGIANVDNTRDLDKPISVFTQSAISNVQNLVINEDAALQSQINFLKDLLMNLDPILKLIFDFKTRVINNNGTFESDQCMKDFLTI